MTLWEVLALGALVGLAMLGLAYLGSCAGANRLLTFREWWSDK